MRGLLHKSTYNNDIPNIRYSGLQVLTWMLKRLRRPKRDGRCLTYWSNNNRVPSEGDGEIDE